MGNIETLTIFGSEAGAITRARKGAHLTSNRKHGSVYLTSEAKELLFGKDAKEGNLLVVHSGIENNWYVASNTTRDVKGFECKINDNKLEASMRVNGMQKTIEKMAETLQYKEDRIVFEVLKKSTPYQGLILYKLQIVNN